VGPYPQDAIQVEKVPAPQAKQHTIEEA